MPQIDPEIAQTAELYDVAPDDVLDAYEAALDDDDEALAHQIRTSFFSENHPHPLTKKQARTLSYIDYPPKIGDMVYVAVNGHYARLLTISSDEELAIVKEWAGAYVVPYSSCKRIR